MSVFLRSKYGKFAAADAGTRVVLLKRAVWRYGLRPPIVLALGSVGLLAFAVLRMLRPLVEVRVGSLVHNRLGHLAVNTELFLRRRVRRANPGRELVLFVTGAPVNRQLVTMIKRRVSVTESPMIRLTYEIVRGLTKSSDLWIDLPMDSNEYDEFNSVPPQLSFTVKEKAAGRDLLTSMGIEPEAPFVCFHARDKTYLDTSHPERSREGWSVHDFRNGDIRNYLPAVEHLTSRGIYGIRMGHIVERPLLSTNPMIVDYARSCRSDFGDVFIPAHCRFFLGDTSGLSWMSFIFQTPVALANLIPIQYPPLGKQCLFIPKKLWSVEEKRLLSFWEIVTFGIDGWVRSQQYDHGGIEVIENTADEILALAKEMLARLDGAWVTTDEDEELQRRYRSVFPPGHHCYGFPSRIGAEFLRQNVELLEQPAGAFRQ